MAAKNLATHRLPKFGLEDALERSCITVCTYLMGRFGRLRAHFQNVSESTVIAPVKFVFLLFTFPAFKLSNLFFEAAYTIQQRRLVRLGRECAALGGKDYSLKFDNLSLDHLMVAQRYHRLCDIASKAQGGNDSAERTHVSHGVSPYASGRIASPSA